MIVFYETNKFNSVYKVMQFGMDYVLAYLTPYTSIGSQQFNSSKKPNSNLLLTI